LEDRTVPWDLDLGPAAVLDRSLAAAATPPRRALTPALAHVMSALLRQVARTGTARRLAGWPWPAAGKTGTSDRYDAWFVGYTSRLLALVWLGPDDNDRALGKDETGARVALPAWLTFMRGAHPPTPPEAPWPPRPPGIEDRRIDPRTGLRARDGEGLLLPFLKGTAPTHLTDRPAVFGRGAVDRTSLTF